VLTLIGESKNIRLLLAVYNNIGNVYSKMNQNKKAVVYHQKALAMAQELKDPLTIAIQQVSLGKTLIATQSYGLGSQLLNKASPVFGKLKAYNNLLVTYQALIEVNNKIEDYKQSVTYYEKFVALKDSLIRTEQNRTLDSLKVRLNTEQALSDNLLLEQKNLIQAKTISLQRTIMFSAFIFAFLLMGFIVFVIINRRKIKNINRLLALKNNEISAKANELNVKNQQLVEFAKYKDSMNSFLVHDLKNPLNTIVNANIEQLSKQEAEAFKHSGLRMLNIVTSLLDLSKYENQMLKLSVTHTYVGKMIQDASKEVLFLAKQKSISIALKFQSDYQVKVDAELIKRVFVNLFINAIKFSESGKQIHVFAENLAGSTVKISIADEGEGISPEYLPHVFERFTQEIPRNAGFSASTGIGLAFCKMAIEMHGGQIEVISDKGKGTTFWFTLPLVAPGPVETMIKDSIVIEAPKPANIILSKEEKDYLRPFCQKLQSISVYQLTDVKNTVIPIQENTPNLSVWKHALLKALSDCNEPSYRNLIMICHA
jgi:signal transduction histidine kinase